jgi:hypothetical protein
MVMVATEEKTTTTYLCPSPPLLCVVLEIF